MARPNPDVEMVSLPGDLRRDSGLSCLLAGTPREAAAEQLVLVAGGVTDVDVVTGTAMRLRIARHRRLQPEGVVEIMGPAASTLAAANLGDLLDPLPDGVILMPRAARPARGPYALVPATLIGSDSAAVAAATYALEACDRARIAESRATVAAEAVMELASNALRHAGELAEPPVVAMTVSGRERTLEVAATDGGTTLSESDDPLAVLGAVPGVRGFLAGLSRQRRGDRPGVSVEMLAGTARLRWHWNGHRTTSGLHVPGTTVVVRIAS